MPDPEQIVMLVVTSVGIVLLLAPFVGVQLAARRRRRKQRSVGAVVLASMGTLAALVTVALQLVTPLYAVGLVVANVAWLASSVRTNREVARRLAFIESQRSP